MTASALAGPDTASRSLPHWLETHTTYGLLAGTVLSVAALFTNPVPDPSFPWATLPASMRLPVTQPRIEHWPVTYTLVCWLYCSSYDPLWSNVAYLVAALGIGATLLAAFRSRISPYALALFGVLALPLGLPALYEGYRRSRTDSTVTGGDR